MPRKSFTCGELPNLSTKTCCVLYTEKREGNFEHSKHDHDFGKQRVIEVTEMRRNNGRFFILTGGWWRAEREIQSGGE